MLRSAMKKYEYWDLSTNLIEWMDGQTQISIHWAPVGAKYEFNLLLLTFLERTLILWSDVFQHVFLLKWILRADTFIIIISLLIEFWYKTLNTAYLYDASPHSMLPDIYSNHTCVFDSALCCFHKTEKDKICTALCVLRLEFLDLGRQDLLCQY